MKKTIKEQLRLLVKEHESDLLPTEDYRRLRSALLERASAGDFEVPEDPAVTRPREAKRAVAKSAPKPAAAPTSDRTPPPKKRSANTESVERPNRLPLFAGLGALLALVAGGAYWFTVGNKTGERVAQEDAQVAPAHTPASRLASNFVSADDWSPTHVSDFAAQWAELDSGEVAAAKKTGWYRELARALRDRLNFSEMSDGQTASESTQALMALARSMQLRVESRFANVLPTEKAMPKPNPRPKQVNSLLPTQQASKEPIKQVVDTPPVPTTDSADVDQAKAITADVSTPSQSDSMVDIAVENPVTGELTNEGEALDKVEEIQLVTNDVIGVDPTANAPELVPEEPVMTEGVSRTDSVSDLNIAESIPVPDADPSSASPAVAAQVDTTTNGATEVSDVASEATPPPVPASSTVEANPVLRNKVSPASTCRAELVLQSKRKSCRDRMADDTAGPKMQIVRAGEFAMGSTQRNEEKPVHSVVIETAYAIAAAEVSFADYAQYCNSSGAACPDNPWGDSSLPVVGVTWDNARAYASWLSGQTGGRYRLPSEAEWEFAARAGTTSTYPFGEQISFLQAHFSDGKRRNKPVSVNSSVVLNNKLGLKHVIGNVAEWVEDAWRADYSTADSSQKAYQEDGATQRVVRGGSYVDRAAGLRSAARVSQVATETSQTIGFRLVRDIE